MTNCVYLRDRPSGGIGNRLFTYNFLLQVARQLDFSPNIANEDSSLIRNTRVKFHSLPWHLSSSYLDSSGVPGTKHDFEAMLNNLAQRKKCLRISNTFLGETFFQSTTVDPREFFPLLMPEPRTSEDAVFKIGMHFRGTDFKTWNPKSILSPEYYLDSFEYLMKSKGSENCTVTIYTDDLHLNSIKVVTDKLRDHVPLEISSASSPTSDLRNLAGCKAIISSPSTFAIWAGIFSTKSVIIHSKEWVTERAKLGDDFWVKIAQGGGTFYKVGALV